MVASEQHGFFKVIWTKAEWCPYTSHLLFGIGDIMKDPVLGI